MKLYAQAKQRLNKLRTTLRECRKSRTDQVRSLAKKRGRAEYKRRWETVEARLVKTKADASTWLSERSWSRWKRLGDILQRARARIAERSLLALAELSKSRFAVHSPWKRRRRESLRVLSSLVRDEFSFTWLFLLAFGIPFLPIPWSLGRFADPTAHPAKSESFLQALWQVEGVTLAMAIAVVVFVFQAVYASRLGGSLRQFAEDTGLFGIFYVGVYGVGLDGLVLLGGGHSAPGGWAATWATIWGAVDGALLILLFVSTIHAIEPGAMHRRRLARARREIERETEALILRRISMNLLKSYCEANGIEFVAAFGSAPTRTAVAITPRRAGEIRDVRLWRLRKLGAAARKLNQPPPRLRGYLDIAVAEDTELLWAEPAVVKQVRRVGRIFRIGRRQRERAFRATIEQLHDEATRVIANPTPGAYEDILETYSEMLLALPATWARYGQDYGPSVAGEVSPFELGFLDYLGSDLYDELRAAVLGSNRQVARDALNFPLGVATDAIPLRATALTSRMLNLLVAVIDALVRMPESDTKNDLIDSIVLSLDNYGDFRIEPLITDDDSDSATREAGKVLMLQLYEVLAEISKRILDWDASRTDLVGKFNGIYEKFFRYWTPENADPQRWELELAEQQDAPADQIEALCARVEENEAKTALHKELDDWRLLHRLGLLFWVFRHVRDGADATWAAAWPTFANYFGDVPRMAEILDRAITVDRDRTRWSSWVLETLPSGEAYSIGVDHELIETFIVRALELVSPDGPPPEIEPMESTRGRLDDPQATVDAVIARPHLAPLLPDDRLADRVRVLVEALTNSNQVRQEREEQKIIDAPLVAEKIDQFATKLRENWESQRWLHGALDAAGAVELGRGEAPERAGSQINTWLPKAFFISDPLVLGADIAANRYGAGLAQHERTTYVDNLLPATLVPAAGEQPLSDQLRGLIQSLRDDGFDPTLILVPYNWTLTQSLGIAPYRDQGGEDERPEWAREESSRDAAIGEIEGIPVCRIHSGIDDRLVVVDLHRFATWRQWLIDGQQITISIDEVNEVEAERLAREQAEREQAERAKRAEAPESEGPADDQPPEDVEQEIDLQTRVQQIRRNVRLLAQVRYEIVVRELGAARALEIPEGLRR